jgi:hypothetical protein
MFEKKRCIFVDSSAEYEMKQVFCCGKMKSLNRNFTCLHNFGGRPLSCNDCLAALQGFAKRNAKKITLIGARR